MIKQFAKVKLNSTIILIITLIVVSITAFCVNLFYFNINHSVALEQNSRCEIPEHIHVDSCYDGDVIVCREPAHTHDGNCYLVLLKDNDINRVLTLIGDEDERSLEAVIDNTVATTLNYNENLNSVEGQTKEPELDTKTVSLMNRTISNSEDLPDLVFNEHMNTLTAAIATVPPLEGIKKPVVVADEKDKAANADVGDSPQTGNNKANFYVYIDGAWTCIGTLNFTNSKSGNYYYNTIATNDVLNLINSALGTSLSYNSFGISSSTSVSNGYSTSNRTINATTTTIYRNRSSSTNAKYVRIIPVNGSSGSTSFNFYSVTLIYPDGTREVRYVRAGTDFSFDDAYSWNTREDGNGTEYSGTKTINGKLILYGTERGEVTYININYDIAFPTVSGVTVSTKPTIAGIASTTVQDEYTQGSSATVRNVSNQSVKGTVNGNSTGLSRTIQFKGWKVGNTEIIIQPNTTLVWEELQQYASGHNLKLTGVWEYNALQTATFFVRYDSIAVDTEGNTGGQDSSKYTPELFATYVGGVDTGLGTSNLQKQHGIADTTADNSFGADQEIRALYGEKTDGVWLYSFPNDDYIFEELKKYATNLRVDGEPVKAEDLNDREYAIRWYVFKCQDDAWHIDGKLVKKEGLIYVYKTFAGNRDLIELAKEGFYIDAHDKKDNKHTILDFNNVKSYNSETDTYMWEIGDIDYDEPWTLTEYPNDIGADNAEVEYAVYSSYNIMDAIGDQSKAGEGQSMSLKGVTYALDEGIDEVLKAEFTNIYNRSNSIVIKKQDAKTGQAISGAEFQLMQNGKALKFNYNADKDIYEYAGDGGTITNLAGNANGYYEINIEDFSYDEGPVTICEVKAPEGYSPIGNIEVGYNENKVVDILSGESDMVKYTNGVLIIGNSTDSESVTVQKKWDCPENEWQEVKVQLLANGKLVSAVVAGVTPEVTLNGGNSWKHTWTNLPVYVNGTKIEWTIKEIQIGSEKCKSDGTFVNWLASYALPIKSKDADGNDHTLLTVTNTTKRVMLRLTKTDTYRTEQLKGASFTLEAVDANGNVITSEVAKSGTTGNEGTLIFDNLKCNVRYRITETVAPEGYYPLDDPIYATINEDGTVKVESHYYASSGSTAYNIVVANSKYVTLPDTGGTGHGMFYAAGLLLMAAGIYITLRKRRWQRRT